MDIPCLWIGTLNIANMAILSDLQTQYNPYQNSNGLSGRMEKANPHIHWELKRVPNKPKQY